MATDLTAATQLEKLTTRATLTGDPQRDHANGVRMSPARTQMKANVETNGQLGALTRVEPTWHLRTPHRTLVPSESTARLCSMLETTLNVPIVLGLV